MKLLRFSFGLLVSCVFAGAASSMPPDAAVPTDTTSSASLFIETNGVALSKFPSHSRLKASVQIGLTSKHAPVSWVAASNAAWLTVTQSGETGQILTLTANPAGLPTDTVNSALVTVKTGAAVTPASTATITVSFWAGSTDPQLMAFSGQAVAMATNPVTPWVYMSTGSSIINVFNVYDGQLVTTFKHVAPTVGQMVVSSDGSELFAVDTTNYRIVELNAATGKTIKTFDLTGPIQSDFSFAYARPAGKATLFAPGQAAIDVATGAKISAPLSNGGGEFYDPLIQATPDGAIVVILERGLDPASLYSYEVAQSGGGGLTISQINSAGIVGENCQAMAINKTASMVYPACGAPYEFDVYDAKTLLQIQTLPAEPYPNNAVIDSDGYFVGGINGLYEADDVFVYNPAGYSLGNVPTTTYSYGEGQGSNLLVTSGDSLRVISATAAVYNADQTLMFRNLPP